MSAAKSGRGGQDTGAPAQDDPSALVEDINQTRAELGDTVEALVAKVDVKARAQQRAAEVSTQAKVKLQAMKQDLGGSIGRYRAPFAAAATAVAAAVLTGWLAVRRR